MANLSQIRSHVRTVTKKSSTTLPTSLFDTWEPIVRQRLLNDLQMNRQLLTAEVKPTENPFEAVSDLQEVISITYMLNSHEMQVQPASLEQVNAWVGESGNPQFYASVGQRIKIAPYALNDDPNTNIRLNVTYRTTLTPLTNGDSVNYATVWHEGAVYSLFLNLAFAFVKDMEQATYYAALYESEVESINDRMLDIRAFSKLQMRGASSWV